MKIALITGSCGLVGSESVEFFIKKKFKVIGIDNDYRKFFFGKNASTLRIKTYLTKKYKKKYLHFNSNISNTKEIEKIFKRYKSKIKLVIHSAAQPSHDWAASNPELDFNVNAIGTSDLVVFLIDSIKIFFDKFIVSFSFSFLVDFNFGSQYLDFLM